MSALSPGLALWTAARRHCMDRAAELADEDDYPELTDAERFLLVRVGSLEDRPPTWPRERYLENALEALESVVPDRETGLDDVRRFVTEVGEQAWFESRMELGDDLAEAIEDEERRLREAVAGLDEDELARVEPLFHRRHLAAHERDRLWVRAEDRYGVRRGEYWYPLVELAAEDSFAVEAFHAEPGGELSEALREAARAL